jgi:hypothetical protein
MQLSTDVPRNFRSLLVLFIPVFCSQSFCNRLFDVYTLLRQIVVTPSILNDETGHVVPVMLAALCCLLFGSSPLGLLSLFQGLAVRGEMCAIPGKCGRIRGIDR